MSGNIGEVLFARMDRAKQILLDKLQFIGYEAERIADP